MGSRNCRSAKQKVEKEKHREKEQPQRRRWVKTITICYENVLSFAFWFFRLNSHFLRIVVLLVCDLDTTFTTEKKYIFNFRVCFARDETFFWLCFSLMYLSRTHTMRMIKRITWPVELIQQQNIFPLFRVYFMLPIFHVYLVMFRFRCLRWAPPIPSN